MSCPCKEGADAGKRSGACAECIRKHLLKARGYAAEVSEDAARTWENDNLIENFLLAEDHARAFGDEALAATIRGIRLDAESGSSVARATALLYDFFKSQYAPKQ